MTFVGLLPTHRPTHVEYGVRAFRALARHVNIYMQNYSAFKMLDITSPFPARLPCWTTVKIASNHVFSVP